MRTVTFGVANSLDNFIARADHSVDWLRWGPEAAEVTAGFWKTIDTVVMGRKTWEVAARLGTPVFPGVRNCLCSRTLAASPHPEVELVPGDVVPFLRGLRAGTGAGICVMGGGELARPLLEAGLIDELGFNLHPCCSAPASRSSIRSRGGSTWNRWKHGLSPTGACWCGTGCAIPPQSGGAQGVTSHGQRSQVASVPRGCRSTRPQSRRTASTGNRPSLDVATPVATRHARAAGRRCR